MKNHSLLVAALLFIAPAICQGAPQEGAAPKDLRIEGGSSSANTIHNPR
ncbi:MAG: hypothetical protein WC299_11630 [Kiritimatiellia bacterium]